MSCRIISTASEMKLLTQGHKSVDIGFIPTMGALHEGHLTLIKQAQKKDSVIVVSIFVNPTQFNNPKDFAAYPHRVAEDIKKLELLGVDYVFLPSAEEIYPHGYQYKVHEDTDSKGLCGDTRPGHFDGVLTVLIKLFHIVQPTRVYMGLKDYQQWRLVKGMVKDLFMDIDVVGVPTVRTKEGLALSSRNLNLNAEQLAIATQFAQILNQPQKNLESIKKELEALNIKIDYLEERWGRRFAAVFVGDVRLIDNVSLNEDRTESRDGRLHVESAL
ncbi:MAG: pantoate--beta-alanine ligase [Bdellovibrionaceae bacterium]|nr:pantoate--beta-alanine ligase [Pseudobdellovibrionaceae bacterium]